MENVILKKIISISGIEAIKKSGTDEIIGAKVITPDGERDVKYTLWFNKSNGEPTKAYLAFKNQMIGIGSKVGIGYTEEPNNFEYTDKKTGEKKVAQSTNRKILFFSNNDNIKEFNSSTETLDKAIERFEEEREEQIDVSKIPF